MPGIPFFEKVFVLQLKEVFYELPSLFDISITIGPFFRVDIIKSAFDALVPRLARDQRKIDQDRSDILCENIQVLIGWFLRFLCFHESSSTQFHSPNCILLKGELIE